MSDKKVLFIADEIAPFISKSPTAEFCRTLPMGIYESGHEIRTFMPKWGPINERRNQLNSRPYAQRRCDVRRSGGVSGEPHGSSLKEI